MDVEEALTSVLSNKLLSRKEKWAADHLPRVIMWVVWNKRSWRIFEQKVKKVHATVIRIKETLFDRFRGNECFHGVTFGDLMCNWDNVIL